MQRTHLGAEGEITEHRDDLVSQGRRADRRADDNVHSFLGIAREFVINGE
jgi:hypothetical protein